MTLDLGSWLSSFPVREQMLYLDHAAVCPLPTPVAEAMRQRIAGQEHHGYEPVSEWRNHTLGCRHLGSQLIGCQPDDVSIVRSTSEGLSLIAQGLDWKKGDQILLGSEEFAANVAPWLALARRGVSVVRYPQHDGRVDPNVVEDHVSDRTRLLAISWVAFHSGWIAPLAQLGRLCHDRDILLVVDGIQGLGVLPMNMSILGVDAIVADAHKWLLGPEGVGLMATSQELRFRLSPAISGWKNVILAPRDYFMQRLEYLPDGRRFEPGAGNEIGVAGLAASLDLIAAVGRENIQARVEMLARLVTRVLLAHGWDVFSPGSGHPIAGIVAARPPRGGPEDARQRLLERKVVVSARQGYVRFSPHFYTTRGEIEALDRILEKIGL